MLVVALNPFSKALLSSQLSKKIKDEKKAADIINYSNILGLIFILAFTILGPIIFKKFLGLSDEALFIACGLSLIIFGINYLLKDEIINIESKSQSALYLSIGMPMIVGPASISIITIISSYSNFIYSALLCIIAISLNYLFMIFSYKFLSINSKNEGVHYLIARLTGLLMLAIGIQFILNALDSLIF
jgi:small neutral amino acid transporter SnatA (MarC family)